MTARISRKAKIPIITTSIGAITIVAGLYTCLYIFPPYETTTGLSVESTGWRFNVPLGIALVGLFGVFILAGRLELWIRRRLTVKDLENGVEDTGSGVNDFDKPPRG